MKTILLPITGGIQLEVLRNALAQMREAVQENIDVLDVEDDVDNIEAFEKEMLAIDSIEGNLDDAREGKIVVVIEGGLVADVYSSHHATVFVADRDVENDGRDISDSDLADLIADLKEVY